MEGLDAGLICEVLVTDGGSTDSSGAIAMAWGAEVVIGAASRGGQLRRGVAATRGAWVMVLHADTILQEGWAEQVKARMQQGPLCFSLAFRARGLAPRWVAAWANLRSDVFGLPYGDQGLLSPKGFDKFGNYTFGIKEHIIFPEVSFDRADKVRGLDIVVVIKALNKDHAFALLEKMNFPFIKKGDN